MDSAVGRGLYYRDVSDHASAGPAAGPAVDPSVERFLDTLWIEQGVARNTLAAYRSDLALFARALARDGRALASAGAGDIQEYLVARHKGGAKNPFSARSQALRQSLWSPRVAPRSVCSPYRE